MRRLGHNSGVSVCCAQFIDLCFERGDYEEHYKCRDTHIIGMTSTGKSVMKNENIYNTRLRLLTNQKGERNKLNTT